MSTTERRTLLNPGPSTTSETVKQALVIPDVCPREEAFCDLVREVRDRLATIAGDLDQVTAIPIVGSGTTALEAALVSFVPNDGTVAILDNGDYGRRLISMAETYGISTRVIAPGWGVPVDLNELDQALSTDGDDITHLYFVHHETSSGLLNPLDEITAVAKKHGLTVMVDAMSTFGALPIPLGGDDQPDVLVASSNKCLQGMAGLGFAVATRQAVEDARRITPRSFVLNLVAEFDHLEKTGQARFTVPPQVYSALRQALVEFAEEGIEGRGARYQASMQRLVKGLRALGFEMLLDDECQSGILVSIREPDAPWYDFVDMHDALDREGFTIYPGKLGVTPNFRLAVIGDIDASDIERFLAALTDYLERVR
ncbi:2-aminoethylphosphonate--pyruvate transaminase [Myxococcota bacterium]|nr:2-aminoethylphosphonate--pyruvate transaminase [Myxococcota bacterium]